MENQFISIGRESVQDFCNHQLIKTQFKFHNSGKKKFILKSNIIFRTTE